MIISILNQKGGTGKTTLAVNMARYYTMNFKKTLLVDSDSQGSAQRWHERSNGDLIDLACISVNTLDKDVIKFTDRYERIIIDGIPRVSPLTMCAVKAADVILIPVQPSPYDIWATEDLVRIAKERIEMTNGKTKVAFVISRKITGTRIGKEIEGELRKFDLPVFQFGTCQRIDYATSVEKGVTVCDFEYNKSEASKEIGLIVNELERFAHGVN